MKASVQLPVLPALRVALADEHYSHAWEVGAKGDGKHDDAVVLQAAIDRLPTRERSPRLFGGTVFLPAGTYLLSRPLRLPERVSLLGEHLTATRLMAGPGLQGPLLRVSGEYTRMENLQVHGGAVAVEWHGGLGSTLVNAELQADRCPLRLQPRCEGMFYNLVLRGGGFAVEALRPGQVGFNGLTIGGTGRGGVVVRGGGPVGIEAMTYQGPGRAVQALSGSRVNLAGALADQPGEVAFYCARDSLLYAAALSAPNCRLVLLDESGEGARLAGPTLGLYTGQATFLAGNPQEETRPLRQVRINCGAAGVEDFAGDFGYGLGAEMYGNDVSGQAVDFSHVPDSPAPRRVYLTERSGRAVNYDFPMLPGRYRVRLHMCEIWFSQPGQRVFRVLINEQEVTPEVDILATTGAQFAPIVMEFSDIEPRSGKISISMEGLPSQEHHGTGVVQGAATLSALEILPLEGTTP